MAQTRKATDTCINCGGTEDDHCDFFPVMVPTTCVCEASWWEGDVPDVCDQYEDELGQCRICEHGNECHKKPSAQLSLFPVKKE